MGSLMYVLAILFDVKFFMVQIYLDNIYFPYFKILFHDNLIFVL